MVYRYLLAALMSAGCLAASRAADSAVDIVQAVDAAIRATWDDSVTPAPQVDDAAFLRRVRLDITGDIPPPDEIRSFVDDPAEDKRMRLVRRLLADERYGQNWARYWRDVIFYRQIEARAQIAAGAMEADMADWLNENVPWDDIATEFITAKGDVRENGATAIIMAQDGRTEEVTAEVSRIFLGMQLQCAQCHDHPYDRWKREQFHELAAFFPRLGIRNSKTEARRTFVVYANDRPMRRRPKINAERRPTPEHRMPDLDDPSSPGTQMDATFFLTGDSLEPGASDAARRLQLAAWLTENPWFAKALVNRLWTELVGEGFYETVDDLGPDREVRAGPALQLLADAFREQGYDQKWLIETICSTEAYGRQSRPRREPGEPLWTAGVAQPLRADPLLNAVLSALDVRMPLDRAAGRRGGPRFGPRAGFNLTFGYDPSDPRDTVSGTIPQTLALMNSPQIARQLQARRGTGLRRLLNETTSDDQLVTELYLRTYSRWPDDVERRRAADYLEDVGDRSEAAEDLLWALINSAEFAHRR